MDPANAQGFPPATRHGPLEEIFPDVFFVRGSLRANPLVSFGRNMVVLRDGEALTILNSVRLQPPGERALESLGEVRHVIRLGYFHGRDDAWYRQRYGAQFWAPRGSRAEPGPVPDRFVEAGGELPVPDATAFLFERAKHPEAAVLVERAGGILVTCDALQNHTDRRYTSPAAALLMPLMGFRMRPMVGPLWLKVMTPPGGDLRPDFERLLELDFAHLVPAHGTVRRDDGHAAARQAVEAAFGRKA